MAVKHYCDLCDKEINPVESIRKSTSACIEIDELKFYTYIQAGPVDMMCRQCFKNLVKKWKVN